MSCLVEPWADFFQHCSTGGQFSFSEVVQTDFYDACVFHTDQP